MDYSQVHLVRDQGGLYPATLVFIDESAAKTNMTRLRGRSPRGQRLLACCPHGHWRTTTMISSIRLDGSTACMTIDGPTDTEVFQAYAREIQIGRASCRERVSSSGGS